MKKSSSLFTVSIIILHLISTCALVGFSETVDVLLIPYKEIRLSFSTEGRVKSIDAKEGDHVKAGQVLAQLEQDEEQLRLKHVEKIIEQRVFDVKGSETLFKKNMMPEREFLEKKIELEISNIEKQRVHHQMSQKVLKAPISGQIVKRNLQAAEWVQPGEMVFVLLDNTKIFAEALLSPEQSLILKNKQKVTLNIQGDIVTGKVDFVDPRIDPTSNLVRCKILIHNTSQKLRPGSTGTFQL
jgi:RND family efflux transporter MFP subunit